MYIRKLFLNDPTPKTVALTVTCPFTRAPKKYLAEISTLMLLSSGVKNDGPENIFNHKNINLKVSTKI